MATGNQRRRARVLAMQALYEADSSGHPAGEAVGRIADDLAEPAAVTSYAQTLVEGVNGHREAIDAIIAETASRLPLAEMAVVDRNILRVAIYEVLFDNKTPVRAAVNEAVEVAKEFGGDSSPRFINGVLGAVAARASR